MVGQEQPSNNYSFTTLLSAPRGSRTGSERHSVWSVVWSTTTVPTIDAGRGRGRTITRRFDLRISALLLAGCLALGPHPAAAAVACGGLPFIIFLILFIVLVGNVMRHFEIYLGEWSVSGPGCAFKVVPLLDGIGIAVCILSLMRATLSSAIAAIAFLYVLYSINDKPLPFLQCRDFELVTHPAMNATLLKSYRTRKGDISPISASLPAGVTRFRRAQHLMNGTSFKNGDNTTKMNTAISLLRNTSRTGIFGEAYEYDYDSIQPFSNEDYQLRMLTSGIVHKRNALICKPGTAVCDEALHRGLPPMLPTPSYNFFYLELMYVHRNGEPIGLNRKMLFAVLIVWILIWSSLIVEKLKWNQIVWNNAFTWMIVAVAIWALGMFAMAINSIDSFADVLPNLQSFLHLKSLVAASSALELALYTHACGVGTEIIFGKGLNFYADGHMDAKLAKETIICSGWSAILCLVSGLSAMFCTNKEAAHPLFAAGKMYGNTSKNLWLFPLYAACIPTGNYMHILSLFIFGGLMLMQIIVSIYFVKAGLHCIFEFQAKFIMFEQIVVFIVCLACCSLALLYASRGGIFFLESFNNMLTGLTSTFVCMFELVALLYVYKSKDFITDMLNSNVRNKCPTRVFMLWKSLPIFVAIALLLKIPTILTADQPSFYSLISLIPTLVILLSVPIKGIANSIEFYKGHRGQTRHPS